MVKKMYPVILSRSGAQRSEGEESRLQPEKPMAFHVMLKPRGPICNLACDYCYYLDKAALYPGSDFRMSDAVLESFTRQYIRAQAVPEVVFGWQGGEPLLMGIEFYRRAMAFQRKYRRPGMRVVNTIQTNGMLLTDEWATFFRTYDFLVGLSLDGPRELHDAHRRDRGGRGSFDGVMHGLGFLQKRGVETNILTCVHDANADHPLEIYRFLRDEAGARFIQFIPIVQPACVAQTGQDDPEHDCSVLPGQYGRFLISVFDEWLRHDVDQVSVQIFDVALAAWMQLRPGLCVFEPTCGLAMALEHNGDLYACDHFVTPGFRLGNIAETPLAQLAASAQQQRFGRDKRDKLPAQCLNCAVRFVCNGGCPKNRLGEAGKQPGLNYLCAAYRAFFAHIDRPMSILADCLRAGRDPASAVRQVDTLPSGIIPRP
jgi:uncharacterized protein